MDDTSKKDVELVHLAPTVSHANKALFIVRVSYYVKACQSNESLQTDFENHPLAISPGIVDTNPKKSTVISDYWLNVKFLGAYALQIKFPVKSQKQKG